MTIVLVYGQWILWKGGNDNSFYALLWVSKDRRMYENLYIDIDSLWNPEKCAAGHHIDG